MAFRFKLQSVLDYRKILEDQARQELSAALARETAARQRTEQEESALVALQEDLAQKQVLGISVEELLLYEENIHHRTGRLSDCREELAELSQESETRRAALCHASREKKLLERLREKKVAEHRQWLHRQETNLLDEIAIQFQKGEES